MPKEKGLGAIQWAQRTRWRLLVRNSKFLRDLKNANRTLYRTGKFTDDQREKLGDRWGLPRVPWKVITNFDCFDRDADRIAFLDWCGLNDQLPIAGSAYAPLAVHRVENNRFVFLMADLEHPVDDLAELFKSELRRIRGNHVRSRKRLDKTEDYFQCWDLARREKTLSEIAKEVYPKDWPDMPKFGDSVPFEPSPTEIEVRAKELRQKGQCAYSWSFRQAHEDLLEERQIKLAAQQKSSKTQSRMLSRTRRTLRQRVWRNIQAAYNLIEAVTPISSRKT